ncbi:MAG: RHS repeat-associated core domain-containing protein [Patescibacteria group bacterium]
MSHFKLKFEEGVAQSVDISQLLDYYPYGDLRISTQNGDFDEKRKFTGHEYDGDTGLNYMKARYQNPSIGRFMSVDPVYNKIGRKEFNVLLLKNKYQPKNSSLLTFWLGDNEEINNKILLYDYLTNPQRLNSYSYVINNPLIYTDPLGETESAEKVVNFVSGRGWKTDAQLIDISKIPTQLMSPESAHQEKTYISSPEHAPTGETLSAARPRAPSYNTRKNISDSLSSISEGIDVVGQAADAPGAGAAITLTTAAAVSPLGPEASIGALASYPFIEIGTQIVAASSNLLSGALNSISNWLMNP